MTMFISAKTHDLSDLPQSWVIIAKDNEGDVITISTINGNFERYSDQSPSDDKFEVVRVTECLDGSEVALTELDQFMFDYLPW